MAGIWTAEMEADFQAFHGNKSGIPQGKSFLEPGIMFKVPHLYYEDTYVVIEKHEDHHVVFSNSDETKITHDGGIDLNRIQIFEGK